MEAAVLRLGRGYFEMSYLKSLACQFPFSRREIACLSEWIVEACILYGIKILWYEVRRAFGRVFG